MNSIACIRHCTLKRLEKIFQNKFIFDGFGAFFAYNLYMDSKQGNKMISEMNGDYWLEILFSCYNEFEWMGMDNQTFTDFVKMYCGV